MKTFFKLTLILGLLFLFLFSSSLASAQIKVDAAGNVSIGKQTTSKVITISDETSGGSLSWSSNLFKIAYKANEMVTFSRSSDFGMMFAPTGSIVMGYKMPATNTGYIPLEIYACDYAGGIKVNHKNSSSFAGVSVVLNDNNTYAYDVITGTTRKFYVNGTGAVYVNNLQLTSDMRLKNDIEVIKKPLDKLLQMRGVTFNMNFPKTEGEVELSYDELYKIAKVRTPEITPEIFKQIQEEKSRKQMGIIAQEVEKIIPEVVRTREDGLKSVAYHEMIGLLIEAIKEQQVQIEELRAEIDNTKISSFRSSSETTGINNTLAVQSKLYQNTPNPFNLNTQIKFYVPENATNAQIFIYDLQGKQIKNTLLTQRGEGTFIISGSELAAGMYLYSLIVDGNEVDTKKMVLTK